MCHPTWGFSPTGLSATRSRTKNATSRAGKTNHNSNNSNVSPDMGFFTDGLIGDEKQDQERY
eukprot:253547-Pyramimonas_sp.AAC.1